MILNILYISLKFNNQNMLLFREMEEITAFINGALSDNQCLGRCLYIHGVPGTGKVSSFDLLYCFFSLLSNEALTSFMEQVLLLSPFIHV